MASCQCSGSGTTHGVVAGGTVNTLYVSQMNDSCRGHLDWMILRDNGIMSMLGVRHVHRMDDSCRGHLDSYCQQIVQLMLLALSAYPLAIRYCVVVRTRGTRFIYEIVGENLSCPLAGGHNKNNIRTSIWKPNPMAHLIGIDHSMKLWPLIRTLSTQSQARVGMFAATSCYYWAEQY